MKGSFHIHFCGLITLEPLGGGVGHSKFMPIQFIDALSRGSGSGDHAERAAPAEAKDEESGV